MTSALTLTQMLPYQQFQFHEIFDRKKALIFCQLRHFSYSQLDKSGLKVIQ
jgi:hypothetical protein